MTGAGPMDGDPVDGDPQGVVAALRAAALTVATAESLTAGRLAARLADVPGASAVLRGGVVAYASDIKETLLGVPAALLARVGAVHPDVAAAMAAGVRTRLHADLGVATTGVAGPQPQDGRPVGTVWVAVASAAGTTVDGLDRPGTREQVRQRAVDAALSLLHAVVTEHGRTLRS